jgi:hypothetical protein
VVLPLSSVAWALGHFLRATLLHYRPWGESSISDTATDMDRWSNRRRHVLAQSLILPPCHATVNRKRCTPGLQFHGVATVRSSPMR